MECQEGIGVKALGHLDMDSTYHQVCEEHAISFHFASTTPNRKWAETINGNIGKGGFPMVCRPSSVCQKGLSSLAIKTISEGSPHSCPSTNNPKFIS